MAEDEEREQEEGKWGSDEQGKRDGWVACRAPPSPFCVIGGAMVELAADESELMSCRHRIWLSVCIGWFACGLSGCAPATPGQTAAQREPHFVLGERRLNAGDYQGAIRAFAASLQADPRSAPAHFEMGWLYDEKVPDPAAAIYYYERYLKLEPDAGDAAAVEQRIAACKRKLAVAVFSLPSTAAQQQQLEDLVEQNQQLQDELRRLRANLNGWHAYYASVMAERTNAARASANATVAAQTVRPATLVSSTTVQWLTHVVAVGETAYGIARRYRVPLAALLAANPGLDPQRMPVGLVLNIPRPRFLMVATSRSITGSRENDRERMTIASRAEPGL